MPAAFDTLPKMVTGNVEKYKRNMNHGEVPTVGGPIMTIARREG
jgi:hypothetical protein